MIQIRLFRGGFFPQENEKDARDQFMLYMAGIPTLLFVLWPKITLPNSLCGKMRYRDENVIFLGNHLVLFDECAAVNVP
jgi:hypothetical protein